MLCPHWKTNQPIGQCSPLSQATWLEPFSLPLLYPKLRGRVQGLGGSLPNQLCPNLCCSLQVPDSKPRNNLAPQPSLAGRESKAHPVGAQHGVLAKPKTLPHWPGAPSCLCCPKLPVNSWHFQPLVIQTRNIAEPNLLGLDFLTP